MTYEEIAGLLDISLVDARERVHEQHLDRKISRDGRKRAKLSLEMMSIFIARIRAPEHSLDQAIADLRRVHGLLMGDHQPLKAAHG
jgi:hypothetical protein